MSRKWPSVDETVVINGNTLVIAIISGWLAISKRVFKRETRKCVQIFMRAKLKQMC